MKNIFTLLFIALCAIAVFNSCKGSGTEPGDNYKNPNEMTWTCDTLYLNNVAQTSLEHFLAFGTSNIYAYGWSSDCKNIWKWDGNKWSLIDISSNVLGFNVNKLIGFSNTDIWGFGEGPDAKSDIIRYDSGLGWHQYTGVGQVDGRLLTACADRYTNIYTGGDNGWLLFFNGTTWQKDQIKMYTPTGSQYLIRSSAIYRDTIYFFAFKTNFTGRDVHYIIKGSYNNWIIADSMIIDNPLSQFKWGWWGLYVTTDNKLMSYGDSGVWQYNGKGWDHKLTTVNSVRGVFSLNSNYIITAEALNEVYFYDGSSWTKLNKFRNDIENIIYKDVWGDGKELFIMGNTTGSFPQKTIIWHGK